MAFHPARNCLLSLALLFLLHDFSSSCSSLGTVEKERNLRRPNPPFIAPTPSPSTPICYEYTLENECHQVLGSINVEEEELQQTIFDLISFPVSDIRMFPADCRRPLLWYFCGLAFPPCPVENEEELLCRAIEGCFQVEERCEESFENILNCSSLLFTTNTSSFSNFTCSKRIEKEIDNAVEDPIEVVTCLGEEKETIECCLGSFIKKQDGGECVVECPQYVLKESTEKAILLTLFILIWVGIVFLIIALIPMKMLSINMRYPNYLMFLGLFLACFSKVLTFYVVYEGGPKEYICGNEEDYYVALEEYSHSTKAIMQFSINYFFTVATQSIFIVLSFTTFCFAARMRIPYLRRFVVQPVSPIVEWSMMGGCLLIAGSLSLVTLIYPFANPNAIAYYPSPFDFLPITSSEPVHSVTAISITILGAFMVLFFLLAIGLIVLINFRIFIIQWRALCFLSYTLGGYGFFIWATWYAELSLDPMVEYLSCTATNPRTDPTQCERTYETASGSGLAAAFVYAYFATILLTSVIYFTNSWVVEWWKELVFHCRVMRELPDSTTQNSSTIQNSSSSSATLRTVPLKSVSNLGPKN